MAKNFYDDQIDFFRELSAEQGLIPKEMAFPPIPSSKDDGAKAAPIEEVNMVLTSEELEDLMLEQCERSF